MQWSITCTWNWCKRWRLETKASWERSIRVNWFDARNYRSVRIRLGIAGLALLALETPAVTALRTAAAAAKPAKKTLTKAQEPKSVGAAALIVVAQRQLEKNNFQAASDYAASASAKAPMLDDYAQFIREQAEYGLKNYSEVDKAAARVFKQLPLSPLTGQAAALAVNSALDGANPKAALQLVKKYYERIPQPQGDLLLARSFEATGDLPQAAEYYQRVYYNYPTATKEATEAANALVEVKSRLGDAYPPPMANRMLGRADKLIAAKQPQAARIELMAAIPQLGGVQRDVARVRLGVVDYLSGDAKAALAYLDSLQLDESEADAERLSYLIRCARKLDRNADVKRYLEHLEQKHPASPWRLDALVFVADQARVDHDSGTYLPLYRACATIFAGDSHAAWCHWRVAYDGYRNDASDTYDSLRKQIEVYPKSPDADNALYFLGRYEERRNQLAIAKACYEQLTIRFPNTYYAMIARERLTNQEIEGAIPDTDTLTFLRNIDWPPRPEFPSFTPGPVAQQRMTRAQLLDLAGLSQSAEGELKFGARNDGEQVNVYAYQLAKQASARNAPDRALHYIKAYVPNYLYMPLDQAPASFWQLAFPLPYRNAIDRYSRAQSLDPYLVAALIRQESEFNVRVISYANAYGLMQVMPSNGRELARHFGVRRMKPAQLLTIDRNLQLGTYYFHDLMNSYGGQTELALASYNAGPSRANLWRTWGPFREQAEFIEAVPFHQTRGYIQIVLRNADVYRHLYAGTVPDVPAYHAKPAPKTKPKATRRKHRRPA